MTTEQANEAAILAHRMAKAAGKVRPEVMAQACYMLICTACMVKDPDKYVDMLIKQDKRRRAPTGENK